MPSVEEIYESMDYGPAPEASDYALDWLAARDNAFDLFIGGDWRTSASDERMVTRDPATGRELASFAVAGAADVAAAVDAARTAFPAWSTRPSHERARFLYALARLVQKNSRPLAVLETLDNGKPIRETRDIDVPLVARHFYHHAGWAQLVEREFAGYGPLGVAGQIIPWNFPLLMLSWKIAPAIAAGNTVVLKPAEYTPLTALYFAELVREAGLPPGVINIVTGAGATGKLIVDHPEIDKIAFTGSTEVGREIRRATAGTGKALTLELGGKSPFVVFDDADLDAAVEGLVDAIWFNQGEVCCAGSRLLVEESVAERLLARLKERLSSFRLGNPLDKTVDMGAIVDPVQRERIEAIVAQAVVEGAGKWQPEIDCPAEGCFYLPTLLTEVAPANIAAREEIFGPVLTIATFRTLGEAVELANNTRYGLAASVWSENVNRALDVAAALEAGVVWINCTNQLDAACGFGGYKESGFGREGGREGMLEYLKPPDAWIAGASDVLAAPERITPSSRSTEVIDRTPKHYIGGQQKRADNGNTRPVGDHEGWLAGRVADGNRKDVRDAVEAAFKARNWTHSTGHARAQILYYIAENLSVRAGEFAERLQRLTGVSEKAAAGEVGTAISRLFTYAAYADKHDGRVHSPPARYLAIAVNEPIGVMGLVCPDTAPLASFVSLMAPAMAMGNRCVIIASERWPLLASDFYQLLDTSDVPGGVVNVLTGAREPLTEALSRHDQVDAIWYFGTAEGAKRVEEASADNLKRSWVNHGRARDWFSETHGAGVEFLHNASQIKNIWLPYGD